MNQHRAIRVLIVDDHDIFRTGLRALLEDEGFHVADASGGAEAVRRARAFRPHVVVMDMNMPEMTGVEATPLVLEAAPGASVLMLTIATDDERVIAAVRAAAGHCAIAPRVAGALLQTVRAMAAAPESVPEALELPALSAREHEVLDLLASGCDNIEIAARLYLSPST